MEELVGSINICRDSTALGRRDELGANRAVAGGVRTREVFANSSMQVSSRECHQIVLARRDSGVVIRGEAEGRPVEGMPHRCCARTGRHRRISTVRICRARSTKESSVPDDNDDDNGNQEREPANSLIIFHILLIVSKSVKL